MWLVIYSCIFFPLNFHSQESQGKKDIVKAWKLCSGREKMIYWKTSQPHSGPWSLTMSFMEWHSHAVNDQRHSRVHDCCVTTTLQGWLQARGTTRPPSVVAGRSPAPWNVALLQGQPSSPSPPPYGLLPISTTRRWGRETGPTGETTLFSGNDKLIVLIGWEYLPVSCSGLEDNLLGGSV